jgi:hypothetical protein
LSSFPTLESAEFVSLTDLAAKINEAFRSSDSSRVLAGRLLIRAREKIDTNNRFTIRQRQKAWTTWCAENIQRSMADIRKCMALARAENPAGAATTERAKARVGMAAIRAGRANVSASADDDEDDEDADELIDLSGVRARIGKQAIDIAALSPAAQAQIAEALGLCAPDQAEEPPEDPSPSPEGEGYWRVPPDLYEQLNAEFHFDFDPCPYPRPQDFDGLKVPWGKSNFLNPAFVALNGKDGRGPIAWIRKTIEEQNGGNTTVLLLPPTAAQLDVMLRAGVEMRPIGKDGRVRWLHTRTGEPMPSPPVTIMFIFRGKQVVQLLWPVWPCHREYMPDAGPSKAKGEPRPLARPVVVQRPPPPAPIARRNRSLNCTLGSIGCQYPRLCRKKRRCREAVRAPRSSAAE